MVFWWRHQTFFLFSTSDELHFSASSKKFVFLLSTVRGFELIFFTSCFLLLTAALTDSLPSFWTPWLQKISSWLLNLFALSVSLGSMNHQCFILFLQRTQYISDHIIRIYSFDRLNIVCIRGKDLSIFFSWGLGFFLDFLFLVDFIELVSPALVSILLVWILSAATDIAFPPPTTSSIFFYDLLFTSYSPTKWITIENQFRDPIFF